MLNFLLRRRPQAKRFDVPIRSEGLVYAVGDVHGRADLLQRLLARVEADAQKQGGPAELVFLGDYVDRGEDSRAVIDLLTGIESESPFAPVFLMGNHEEMLLQFVRDPERGTRWLQYGGLQTLMSYGVAGARPSLAGKELTDLRDALVEAMGPHLQFLKRLSISHQNGNVLFVHAAADPALAPSEQDRSTLLWGCDSFTRAVREDGIWVVHGHTAVDEPLQEAGRIAVDTGAYHSGRLTAVKIEGGETDFLVT